MTDLNINAAERRSHSSVLSGETRTGWFISADTGKGETVQLSRFDDEAVWTIDAMFALSGIPLWVNGFGARALLTKTLAPDFAAIVDQFVADAAVKGFAS